MEILDSVTKKEKQKRQGGDSTTQGSGRREGGTDLLFPVLSSLRGLACEPLSPRMEPSARGTPTLSMSLLSSLMAGWALHIPEAVPLCTCPGPGTAGPPHSPSRCSARLPLTPPCLLCKLPAGPCSSGSLLQTPPERPVSSRVPAAFKGSSVGCASYP